MSYESARAKGLPKIDREIIMAMADHGMRAKDAGKAVHYSPSSISYHLDRINEITGLDPRDFYDLWKLVKAIKRGDINA